MQTHLNDCQAAIFSLLCKLRSLAFSHVLHWLKGRGARCQNDREGEGGREWRKEGKRNDEREGKEGRKEGKDRQQLKPLSIYANYHHCTGLLTWYVKVKQLKVARFQRPNFFSIWFSFYLFINFLRPFIPCLPHLPLPHSPILLLIICSHVIMKA